MKGNSIVFIRVESNPDGISSVQQKHFADEKNIYDQAAAMKSALESIALIGGNLPDDRLTDRTGPNDAAHRGLMYVNARDLAKKALETLQKVG